jgi:hypothetical protein
VDSGHSLPPVYPGPLITFLSHTANSTLTSVQFKCSNCTTWSVGKLNVQSTAADFIYAYGDTPPTTPSNPDSPFEEHVDHGDFTLNMKNAQTSSAAPPTITSAPKSSGGGLSERQWVTTSTETLVGLSIFRLSSFMALRWGLFG